jgi:hypothetical protein
VGDDQRRRHAFICQRLQIGAHHTYIAARREFRHHVDMFRQVHALPNNIQRLFRTQIGTDKNALNIHFLTFQPGCHLTRLITTAYG